MTDKKIGSAYRPNVGGGSTFAPAPIKQKGGKKAVKTTGKDLRSGK